MKEQILDRLARLLKYFKGLEHENNEKEYAYILKGTINGITYSIKNVEDFFENEEYLAKKPPFNPEYNSIYWYLAPCGDYCSKCFLGDAKDGTKRWVTEIIANGVEFVERKADGGSASGGEKGGMEAFGTAVPFDEEIPF